MKEIRKLETVFLDSGDRGNSKTYYYLRLMAHYRIPLIVHNEYYANKLREEAKEKLFVSRPLIYSINDYNSMRNLRRKLICDSHLVRYSNNYFFFRWYSDDDLRDIILTDMADGRAWIYEGNESNIL